MAEVFEYGGYGVNCKLTSASPSPDVAWVRGNSFVLVASPKGPFLHKGQRVDLVSINGMGEVRWPVWKMHIEQALELNEQETMDPNWDSSMHLSAFRHFGLTFA